MTPFGHLCHFINYVTNEPVIRAELRGEILLVLSHNTKHNLYLITTVKTNDPDENYADIVAYEKPFEALEGWAACLKAAA